MDRSRDWLAQAKEDLESAKKMVAASDYEWACFIAQQSAEKALKALLEAKKIRPWGHDLLELTKLLPNTVTISSSLQEGLHRLNLFYVTTRYPDVFPEGYPAKKFSQAQAKTAITDASAVIEFVNNNI
ncbi:MAG: HEPN domain-containing protein [Candidatus Ranarchaeia archaeon]